MIALDDYNEDFIEDPGLSLDDSGNVEDDVENDEEGKNCVVDPHTEVAVLRKKIVEMEKENELLKVQMKTYECAGKC